ncbi:MAG: glutamate--tRNA ligase [Flavobacteriaceae bacterium]
MERVRFAPSPTGPLHIGGVRTALFNYLYTKNKGGTFIVRVEDTDQNRYVGGAEQYILETLNWLGLKVDESPNHKGDHGPYRQSQRKAVYQKYIQLLIENGKAYYAFDSKEALEEERKEAETKKENFKYGFHNRARLRNSTSLAAGETEKLIAEGDYVIRLKNDALEPIVVTDELRGVIQVNASEIDDKILVKGDGMPTYHFANVVDDHLMGISCVIRGEEWLPSLPLHKLIYDGFGWNAPKFIHLPLILKTEGKGKLSKRDGAKGGFPVFPLDWGAAKGFREIGFLKEGVLNYLALLGWNDGTDKEIFELDELETAFSLGGIQKGGARFDFKKALWVNAQHIKKKKAQQLVALIGHDYQKIDRIQAKVELMKDRAETLLELEKLIDLFENAPKDYDEKVVKRLDKEGCKKLLVNVLKDLSTGTVTKEGFVSEIEKVGLKVGAGMQCLRVALVGSLKGPDLFDFMGLVSKNSTLERIKAFINHLNS